MSLRAPILSCGALGALLLALSPGRADEPKQTPGAAPVGSTDPIATIGTQIPAEVEALLRGGAPGLRRDPFETTDPMRKGFVPTAGVQLPKMSLRAYVERRQKTPVALLEIEGFGVYLVRAGDAVGLTLGGRNTVIRVQSVDQASVRVEAGTLGQVIIIR